MSLPSECKLVSHLVIRCLSLTLAGLSGSGLLQIFHSKAQCQR